MQDEYDEYHPRYYLNKYKITTVATQCRVCERAAYFSHPSLKDLCYSHFLDLLNVGELRWKWSDHEDIWQITERLLSRKSTFVDTMAARSRGVVSVEPLLDGLKVCRVCKDEKHVLQYSIDRSKEDGRNTMCRDCNKTWRKEQYRRHGR